MALEDGIIELIGYLTSYFLDGGKTLVENFGDQAPSLAAEVGAMLEERLNSDTPYGQLWYEYKENPMANEAEMIGALEVLEEADSELSLRLQGYYVAFHELTQPGVRDIIETSEPEETLNADKLEDISSIDDMDDDDEYREENTYLRGNVEDRSTSAMYIEGLDTSIEPNQSETTEETYENEQEDE